MRQLLSLYRYRRLVEDHFPRLAPRMLVAATLPSRLTGTLIVDHPDDRPGRRPYVSWYLEPLPQDGDSEAQIELGGDRLTEEELLALGARTRRARPQAEGWISPRDRSFSGFYGEKPATDLAHKLLWKDLKRVSWVDGTFMSGIL